MNWGVCLDFFDLEGVEFDGSLAAEHADHDFEFAFGAVDVGDGSFEALEWTVDDADDFAEGVIDGVFGVFDAHAFFDLGDFFFGDWGGLGAGADEAADSRGISDDVPGFVAEFHIDKDVALEDLAVNDFTLAVFDLYLLFFGDDCVEDFVGEVDSVDALLDAVGDFVFETGVGVDCVPGTGAVISVYCHSVDSLFYEIIK